MNNYCSSSISAICSTPDLPTAKRTLLPLRHRGIVTGAMALWLERPLRSR